MAAVGEPVDDGNDRCARHRAEAFVAVRSIHDRVDVAGCHRRGVFERLAAGDLAVLHGKRDRAASQLADGRLEAEPRARRVLLEEEQQRAPFERAADLAALARRLELRCSPEKSGVLLLGEIGKREKVALHSSASRSSANRPWRCGVVLAVSAALAADCSSPAIWSLTW